MKVEHSKLFQSSWIFSSSCTCEQSVYILNLACHYISPQEKSNNLYICCILFRFLIKAFLTGISFNGCYLYLGWAGLFCAPTEIITLPPGRGFSNACFTLADDSAIICFPFIAFFFSFGDIGYLPQGSLKNN